MELIDPTDNISTVWDFMDTTTKLQMAAMNGKSKDLIKELIKQGADIHYNKDEALRNAAGNGHTETVKTLLENGADIHAKNDYALRAAAKEGKIETVKVLLEHGANIHAEHGEALTLASKYGHTEIVKTLLEKGADIHAQFDWTLKVAARYNHQETVNLLVIDYNMPVSHETMEYLENYKAQDTIDTIKKRDLNLKLNSSLKTKQDKSFRMKI